MTTDLRDLLEHASDDVPEVDLAQHAWDTARAERRTVRRRVLLGAGAAAAAGALVTVVVRDRAAGPSDPAAKPRADRQRAPDGGGRRAHRVARARARGRRRCSRATRMPRRSPSVSGSGSRTPRTSCSSDRAAA